MAPSVGKRSRTTTPSGTTLTLSPGIRHLFPARNGSLFQLAGNGWEWTSVPFEGFPGFKPFPHYPGYSADFFDGLHFVLKGASPVTPAALVRTSFRNWFQDHYRYAYTAFRCARDL